MTNPLLITLLPVVHCAWLIFESMDTYVLGTSDRSRGYSIAAFRLALTTPFLPSNPSPTALGLAQTLAGTTRLATDQQSSLQSP